MTPPFVLDREPESLCVMRLSAIGDVCHMLAVVKAIQAHYPKLPITWIIGRVEASLVKNIPGIEFIVFDKSEGLSAYWRLYQTLKHRRFDVLLHAQVALRASLATLCIRARHRIGFDKARAKDGQGFFTNACINAIPRQHVLEGLFEFAKVLGVPEQQCVWQFPLPHDACAFAEMHCKNKRVLVMNPSASVATRNWLCERYAEIADYAIERYGYTVILLGGGAQHEIAFSSAIVAHAKHPINNLTGKTTLIEALALMANADAIIAPDTGPVHMAALVGRPAIGLYACSNPERTGPYFSKAWTVNCYSDALKQFCNLTVETAPWGKRVHDKNAMSLITTSMVKEKLDLLVRASEEIMAKTANQR